MHWLSCCHLPVDQPLLSQMKNLCEVAVNVKMSPTMIEKASELLEIINERVGRLNVFLLICF